MERGADGPQHRIHRPAARSTEDHVDLPGVAPGLGAVLDPDQQVVVSVAVDVARRLDLAPGQVAARLAQEGSVRTRQRRVGRPGDRTPGGDEQRGRREREG